jgi:hypothetical protein
MYSLYKGVYAAELEPSEFSVGQNYPNPFKEKTVIKYCVAYKTRVQIIVYNSEGKLIEKLVNEEKKPGTYEVEFDVSACHSCESLTDGKAGRNPKGEIYFYHFEAGEFKIVKEMQLLK